MKSSKPVLQEESKEEKKTMSRSKAIKKAGMVTLAAGTMLTILSSKEALAGSTSTYPAPSASGHKDFSTSGW